MYLLELKMCISICVCMLYVNERIEREVMLAGMNDVTVDRNRRLSLAYRW